MNVPEWLTAAGLIEVAAAHGARVVIVHAEPISAVLPGLLSAPR